MNKKRHHFIPKAYLKAFCDEDGRVFVYRKDDPHKIIHLNPDNTGFHKYYYSLPLPEGGKNNNALENLFSEIEAKWPPIVERLLQCKDVNDSKEDIFVFVALQSVRVPAARDAIEGFLSAIVKAVARILDEQGQLVPKAAGSENIVDKLEVAIDPLQSLAAMPSLLEGFLRILDKMGFVVLHNATDTPFLSSDNPLIWFDPSIPEAKIRPYNCRPDGLIRLLFPVAPNLMIFGETCLRDKFARNGFEHLPIKRKLVREWNRYICRFSYKTVFAQKRGQEALIQKHADISPILVGIETPSKDGKYVLGEFVFGKRKQKPVWKGGPERA